MDEHAGTVTVSVSLPEALSAHAEEQANAGGYSSVSDYIQDLIRADQKRIARVRLEGALLEALESESDVVTSEYWQQLREDACERVRTRRSRAQ